MICIITYVIHYIGYITLMYYCTQRELHGAAMLGFVRQGAKWGGQADDAYGFTVGLFVYCVHGNI